MLLLHSQLSYRQTPLLLFLLFSIGAVNTPSQTSPLVEKYQINLPDPSDRVLLAKFSSDGSKILLVNQKSTQVWSAMTGKLLATFQEPMRDDRGFDVNWQPGGSKILQFYDDQWKKRPAILWDGENGQKIATIEEEAGVIWAEWNSAGDRILSVGNYVKGGWSDHFTFSVRDDNGKIIRSEKHRQYGVHLVRFSTTGDKVIVSQEFQGNRDPIEIFDRDTGKLLQGFNRDIPKVNPLTHPIFAGESPDGRYLCGQIDVSKGVACWRSDDSKPIYYFLDTKETGDNIFLTFSSDSKSLAVFRSRQKLIDIVDAVSGKIRFSVPSPDIVQGFDVSDSVRRSTVLRYDGLFSSDGKYFIVSDVGKQVSLWNLETEKLISRRPTIWHSDYDWFVGTIPTDFEVFKFSSRNGLLLSVSNQVVRIWDPSNGALLKEIAFPFNKKGESVSQRYVSTWSPDGKLLLTASNNNRTLIVWAVTF